MIMRLMAALIAVVLPGPAVAWVSEYLKSDRSGQISACIAKKTFNDAAFLVRLYAEELDLLLFYDGFTLPYGEVLGNVALQFDDGNTYVVIGSTNERVPGDVQQSAQQLFLTPTKDDYAKIFSSLQDASLLTIVFPNGDSYPISLRGSAKALNEASECWRINQTGVYENNPFSSRPNNNPFEPETENKPAPVTPSGSAPGKTL